MGIPASQRLRKQSDFQEVRKSEYRIHCRPFVIQCELGEAGATSVPKLGVIASRRVGNAVLRNYGKRMVREIFRRNAPNVHALPSGSRCIVVLRAGFSRYDFASLEAHFTRACLKIKEKADRGGGK
ncbi:MAG: ribonuclease P protein component [Opitutales bacterium]